MKKIFCLLAVFLLFQSSSFAINFGTYKAETDYGLIDGFKFNFFNREEGQPLVQLKSETREEQERIEHERQRKIKEEQQRIERERQRKIREEQIRIEREKDKPKEVQDDIRLYRFMLENTVAF